MLSKKEKFRTVSLWFVYFNAAVCGGITGQMSLPCGLCGKFLELCWPLLFCCLGAALTP